MTPRVQLSNSYCMRCILGSATDAVVAYSMPVLQLAEAIDSMKRIKKIGQNAIDVHRKELITEILAIVLMVIPFAGKALGPLICSATPMARIALLVGEMGNGGLVVAALSAILGLIAGIDSGTGKLSKGEALVEASNARGLLKASDLAKSPEGFRNFDQPLGCSQIS